LNVLNSIERRRLSVTSFRKIAKQHESYAWFREAAGLCKSIYGAYATEWLANELATTNAKSKIMG
jgi:hypothetical protein